MNINLLLEELGESARFSQDCYAALRTVTNRLSRRLQRIARIIEGAENRISERELKEIYRLAKGQKPQGKR